MQTNTNKVNLTKFNKRLKLFFQLIVIGSVFFFVFDQGLFNELRYIIDSLNIKDAEKIVFQLFVPIKALFDVSQIISLIILVIQIILQIAVIPLFIFLIFKDYYYMFIKNKEKKIFHISKKTINSKPVYITQSKFLC